MNLKFIFTKWFVPICLIVFWAIIFFFIDPLHDFPLNDDWSFSLTVKYLVKTGEFLPQDWLAFPLNTQALWGALFCLPYGFSFEALTISTIVLGLIGILVTYYIVLELSRQTVFAFLAA